MTKWPLDQAHVDSLAKLLATEQLVLFVGAGISRQATSPRNPNKKMPLWADLGLAVAEECNQEIAHFNNNLFDLFDAIASNKGRHSLEEAVRHAIPEEQFEPSVAHKELCKLPWATIVTTNYDDLLARAIPEKNPIVSEANFDWLSREPSRQPKLVHIHGTLANPHTLTGGDFSRWDEVHPRAYHFLESIALNKTILFVGYSFSDPYLKAGLIPWIQKVTKGRQKRHYAWIWRAQPGPIRLLDTRDRIEAHAIDTNEAWSQAFVQLNDAIHRYHATTSTGTRRKLRLPFSLPATVESTREAIVNGYKLYYFRKQTEMTPSELGKKAGVDPREINNLEQVKTKVRAGPRCFKTLDRDSLVRIERVLECIGKLEYGGPDDFLAKYIMYYKVNKTIGRSTSSQRSIEFCPDTKAVVFDFGGTLTRTTSRLSTWERMWDAVGYTTIEAGDFHRQFLSKKISHQAWCDLTAEKLRARGFARTHLQALSKAIEPIPGLEEAIRALHDQGTALYVVSGSIQQIIFDVLGELFPCFTDVKANSVQFDRDGIIKSIKGHQFDFEGKAEYVRRVIEEQDCPALEVLFVGNSLNDSWASQSGARTLCVNPTDVDYANTLVWTDYIREMKSLVEVLPHAQRTPT